MALSDWEYEGYGGLYRYKPTGNSLRIDDVLELKYADWFETTRLDDFFVVISKEYNVFETDLNKVKAKTNSPVDVSIRLWQELGQMRNQKLGTYKILVADPKNPKYKKALQTLLENENKYIQNALNDVEKLIDKNLQAGEKSSSIKLKPKFLSFGKKSQKTGQEIVEDLADFQIIQQTMSKICAQNCDMAAEFDIELKNVLESNMDANKSQSLARLDVAQQIKQQIPSAQKDEYTKRLLEEDAKMFEAFDKQKLGQHEMRTHQDKKIELDELMYKRPRKNDSKLNI